MHETTPPRVYRRLAWRALICACIAGVPAPGQAQEKQGQNDAPQAPVKVVPAQEAPATETPEAAPARDDGFILGRPRLLPFKVENLNADFTIQRGFTFADEESGFALHLGGRLFLDAALYNEDRNTDIGDPFGVADARVEAEATLRDTWFFRASFGVTQTGSDGLGLALDLRDLWASYEGFEPVRVTVGQHDEPFSLEQLTSSRRITFMRRALPDALAPDNNLGASVSTAGNAWTGQAGVFFNSQINERDSDTSGVGVSGRVTKAALRDESRVLHLGGSLAARWTEISNDSTVFSARPEVALANIKYVNTGPINDTDRIYRGGLEAAYVEGPYSLQAEYIANRVTRRNGRSDLNFDGFYIFGSWLLTGETRPYIDDSGNFGAIEANNRHGAVELAARYSAVDLTSEDIRGGKEQNVSLGLNWYLNRQVRLMANYVLVWANDDANDNGKAIGGDTVQILQTRLQVGF